MCQLWDASVGVGLEEMVQVLQCGPSEMGLATFTPGVGVRGSFHKSHLGRDEKGIDACGRFALGISYLLLAPCRCLCGAQLCFYSVLGAQVPG